MDVSRHTRAELMIKSARTPNSVNDVAKVIRESFNNKYICKNGSADSDIETCYQNCDAEAAGCIANALILSSKVSGTRKIGIINNNLLRRACVASMHFVDHTVHLSQAHSSAHQRVLRLSSIRRRCP